MTFEIPFTNKFTSRTEIQENYHADETKCVAYLLDNLELPKNQRKQIQHRAEQLVATIRENNESHGGLDAFLQEFKLSSTEGVALMCLAEALLRIPDADTADKLIQDKLSGGNWKSHLGESESFFVNASTWGLMLTGKVVSLDKSIVEDAGDFIGRLVAKSGEPIIRAAVKQAMKIMGKQFVLAETIANALKISKIRESQGYCYSYDMLGEAARTEQDAVGYFEAYKAAIDAIGGHSEESDPTLSPGISVKLSALHPRYEFLQEQMVVDALYPRLKHLCLRARSHNIGLTIDAEESERLEPSLCLLELLCDESELRDWQGLGFVVQAYQKRAPAVLDWIGSRVKKSGRRIMIRLVKGAYWDTEIKRAQVEGYESYPVYTRKISTDVCYLLCAQKLLDDDDAFYPLFATHNAHSVAAVLQLAGNRRDFEFQCLHGMGEILYDHVINEHQVKCRIYAPVGPHKDLLAYLVRRLLENGANSSFVNRLVDKELPISSIVADPVALLDELDFKPHPGIPVPAKLYGNRVNSTGLNVNNPKDLERFVNSIESWSKTHWNVAPTLFDSQLHSDETLPCYSPCTARQIGTAAIATNEQIEASVRTARSLFSGWTALAGSARGDILRKAADLYEIHSNKLFLLCIREAGKTILDAIAEVREAVDFLRYYAELAEKEFSGPFDLIGPTGERNQWQLDGRGLFVCISPWNFPLAIFTGQISAALAAGNCVLAKPAEQTPIIAHYATSLLLQAGVPNGVLQLLTGNGRVGARLVEHDDINGVTFTGSTAVAKIIQQTLANKPGAIAPLIAETGGMNAMIVDSTALAEQVVRDVIQSAFQSAGQRCSALRVLYLQEDIADAMLEMLCGAIHELKIGDSEAFSTDVGPIIDLEALTNLEKYIDDSKQKGLNVIRGPVVEDRENGYFFSPCIVEIDGIESLEREIFGPVLHICRFGSKNLMSVVDDINRLGYGLTFGIHSRIQSTIEKVTQRIRVGNIYVNRNTIGAVVGVQPFGGEGLSGTGPKAGGPHYLHQFAVERSISTDTTAAGGNTSLLSLEFL